MKISPEIRELCLKHHPEKGRIEEITWDISVLDPNREIQKAFQKAGKEQRFQIKT